MNFPEIVSADPAGITSFVVNKPPFPKVTISARVRWEWDFGDGSTLVTDNPGHPFDAGEPDIDGYVTHTYQAASDGWPLTVTSIWTASYTAAGVPGVRTVTGAVRRTSTRSLPAAEYASVLVGN